MRATEGAQEVRPALRERAITLMTEDSANGGGLGNFVGPVLRVGDLADAVVCAIEEDNPGKQVRIVDRGDYVRIHTEQRCRLTKQTLERLLGYAYDLRLLEIDMIPYFKSGIENRELCFWVLADDLTEDDARSALS